jgi:hypothetical protein
MTWTGIAFPASSVGIAVVQIYFAVVRAITFAELQLSEILLQLSHNSYVIRCAAYSKLERTVEDDCLSNIGSLQKKSKTFHKSPHRFPEANMGKEPA